MNETPTISVENIEPLLEVVEWFDTDVREHFENMKAAIMNAVSWEGYQIKFDSLIRLIDYLFEIEPTSFINNGVTNQAGENLWSLKVLSIALLLWFDTDQALKLFGEHWASVNSDPDWESHQNIRALNEYWIEGVKIYWNPLSKKDT